MCHSAAGGAVRGWAMRRGPCRARSASSQQQARNNTSPDKLTALTAGRELSEWDDARRNPRRLGDEPDFCAYQRLAASGYVTRSDERRRNGPQPSSLSSSSSSSSSSRRPSGAWGVGWWVGEWVMLMSAAVVDSEKTLVVVPGAVGQRNGVKSLLTKKTGPGSSSFLSHQPFNSVPCSQQLRGKRSAGRWSHKSFALIHPGRSWTPWVSSDSGRRAVESARRACCCALTHVATMLPLRSLRLEIVSLSSSSSFYSFFSSDSHAPVVSLAHRNCTLSSPDAPCRDSSAAI
ncbi:hypothetical protein IWX50DRAFT_324658 [Phyllosticta citricarpa]